MKDKFFIDSNIALYALLQDSPKGILALTLLEKKPLISTQVVAESVNVCLRKLKLPKELAFKRGVYLMNLCEMVVLGKSTFEKAFETSMKYHFSFWDSLIVAAALESDCAVLYSEVMSHNQLIDDKLRIVNPFSAM